MTKSGHYILAAKYFQTSSNFIMQFSKKEQQIEFRMFPTGYLMKVIKAAQGSVISIFFVFIRHEDIFEMYVFPTKTRPSSL